MRQRFCLNLLVCLWMSPLAHAKAPTVRLTITGPSLAASIHTTDRDAVRPNVWGGDFARFVAGSDLAPDADAPRYQIQFWVDLGHTTEVMYRVTYVPATASTGPLVCLPGVGEKGYRSNISTIIRREFNGRCVEANREWSGHIDRLVGQ